MRYLFHIVDKNGLCPDGIGCECADHDAAVLHARHIATELAKAGELFRASFVFGHPGRRARIGKSSLEAVDRFPALPST
jgi:hypothetical protein